MEKASGLEEGAGEGLAARGNRGRLKKGLKRKGLGRAGWEGGGEAMVEPEEE